MLLLRVIVILIGLVFTIFGYLILFQKKYNLINGFGVDFKTGRKTEADAKRIGKIEFALGLILLAVGIVLILAL